MANTYYRGDTWELEYQITDTHGTPIDLTNYQIRAELKIGSLVVRKANNRVVGGSDEMIKILDTLGNITITIKKEETALLTKGNCVIEIEITSPQGKRTTMGRFPITVEEDIITWENLA